MKTMIALGVVGLFLLLVVTLCRTSNGRHPDSEGNPPSIESQPLSNAAPARRAMSHSLQPQEVQPVHAMLLAAIEAETDSDIRSEALERAVESVSDVELPALLDSLALDTSPGAAELSLLLVRRWAESDPVAAATWTSQMLENPVRRDALEQVAIAWANTDLPAAAAWVQALPDGESKHAATFAFAYETVRTEPVAALDLASTLPATRERDDLLVHAISQWAAIDSATAAAWAMEVSDPTLRERLVASVAVASADADGVAAATLAANSLGAGEEQNRATVSIVQRWAQTSPQAAAAWVSQFPDIPLRAAAVENLLALWTIQDTEAAGNWVHELPMGSLRELGISAYAQTLADQARTSAVAATTVGM